MRAKESEDEKLLPIRCHEFSIQQLLMYTQLLAETLPRAHSNLREAYTLVHKANKASFSTSERRLISWLRLLDARAVSTAGVSQTLGLKWSTGLDAVVCTCQLIT